MSWDEMLACSLYMRVVQRDEISACWVKGEPFLSIKRGPSLNPLTAM